MGDLGFARFPPGCKKRRVCSIVEQIVAPSAAEFGIIVYLDDFGPSKIFDLSRQRVGARSWPREQVQKIEILAIGPNALSLRPPPGRGKRSLLSRLPRRPLGEGGGEGSRATGSTLRRRTRRNCRRRDLRKGRRTSLLTRASGLRRHQSAPGSTNRILSAAGLTSAPRPALPLARPTRSSPPSPVAQS